MVNVYLHFKRVL